MIIKLIIKLNSLQTSCLRSINGALRSTLSPAVKVEIASPYQM